MDARHITKGDMSMELQFAAAARPELANEFIQRRRKLVSRIDQQIGYLRQMIDGKEVRAAWVWLDEAGSYSLPIKYGRHPIELKKGMYSIVCKDLDEVEHALCTVRALVLDGQFDAQLKRVSSEIRERLNKAVK
jgi:hypothetical protein